MKKVIIFTNPFRKEGVEIFVNKLAQYGNEVIAVAISESNVQTPINNPAGFDFTNTCILIALENQAPQCYNWNNLLSNCDDLYIVFHKTGQGALIENIRNYIAVIKEAKNINISYKVESHITESIYYEWLPKVIDETSDLNELTRDLIKKFPNQVLESKLELLHKCLVPSDSPSLNEFTSDFQILSEYELSYKNFKETKKKIKDGETLEEFTDNDVFDPHYIAAVKQLRVTLLSS